MWIGPRLRYAALLGTAIGVGLVLLPASDAAAQSCTAPAFSSPPVSLPLGAATSPWSVAFGDFNLDDKPDFVVAERAKDHVALYIGDGAGGFGLAATPAVGTAPVFVLVADFDRDGKPDVAVANGGSNDVSILLGDGAGGFAGALGSPLATLGRSPASLAVADFNGDGILDLVVGAGVDALVFQGNADGSFGPGAAAISTVGSAPVSVVTGDFNRDGKQDFAGAASPGAVLLYPGNGAFGFGMVGPFGVGLAPVALVAGDFNRDSLLDLATANSSGQSISVLLNTGPTFSGADYPMAASTPTSLATGDFNGDGALDLVAADQVSNRVGVTLNDGVGGFPSFAYFGAGGQPQSVAVADFTRDGRPDLATANPGPNAVSLLKNTLGIPCPKASLKAIPVFDAREMPTAVARGDFNGDFRADLVVANYTSNDVSILLGAGPGDFSPGATLLTGAGPYAVTVADFDGNTNLDFAVANSGASNVTVYLGNGAGGFAQPSGSPFGVGNAPISLDAADFDGDGNLDLAVSNNGTADLTILKGDGLGGFPGTTTVPLAGTSPAGLAAGDFDNDGYPDLVVADYNDAQSLVLINDKTGGFLLASSFAVGTQPRAVAVGYFDGDGLLDFATASQTPNNVSVWLGKAGGGFVSAGPPLAVGAQPYGIAVGDFNGDRNADLATADFGASTVSVLLGNGGGGFAPAPTSPVLVGASPTALVVGELTGDGHADLAVAQLGDDNLALLAGDGAGDFTHSGQFAAGLLPTAVASGDFDRDGKPDLVVSLQTLSLGILRGDGLGGFGPPTPYSGFGGPRGLAVADLNTDGWPDVAAADVSANAVALLMSNGAGGFTPGSAAVSGTSPLAVVVGDFNRDGALDLATANNATNNVTILPGPSFSIPGTQDVGAGPAAIVAADFDHDGILDLATADAGGNRVTVLWGFGNGTFPSSSTLSMGASATPRGLTVADFNRDGHPDLAASDTSGNAVTLFYGDGAGSFALPSAIVIGRASHAIASADLDDDGWPDLAVAVAGLGAFPYDDELLVLRHNGAGFDPAVGWVARSSSLALSMALTDLNRDGTTDLVTPGFTTNEVSVFLNTNCHRRRLAFTSLVSSCDAPGAPFASQPALQVLDDGGSRIQCDASLVTASLPGVGNPSGASLGGITTTLAASGTATFSNLSVNLPGRGYQLDFSWPGTPGARSAPFTEGLNAVIDGPNPICQATVATYLGSSSVLAGPLDGYAWKLDAVFVPPPNVSLTLSGLAVGTHALELMVKQDSCGASAALPLIVQPPLTAVTASMVSGAPIVRAGQYGGTVGAAPIGGGPVSYQWSYGTVSGSYPTTIATATTANYQIYAPHFGGSGVYYLTARATPQLGGCGPAATSNEIVVTVYAQSAGNDVPFLTVTSKDAEDKIEWLNPGAPYFGTTVWAKNGGPTGCTPISDFPAGPGDGVYVTTQPGGGAGAPDYFARGGLTNGVYTCYGVFVQKNALGTDYSLGRTIVGRPFDTTGPVKWAFATGTAAMAPPSVGSAAAYTVGNDRVLHAMTRGVSGGVWPAGWTPSVFGGPVQGRSPVVGTPVGAATRAVFAGSQDGYVYAVNADAGGSWLWQSPVQLGGLPGGVQAAPVGMFTAFGGTVDYLFVGTHPSSPPRAFYALKASDGSVVSTYGNHLGLEIGIVSGPGTVDYGEQRVYFTSFLDAAGKSVWCFDIDAGGLTACAAPWPVGNADIAAAPTLRGSQLYVGTMDGRVQAYDTNGTLQWEFTPALSDGAVKGTVFADPFSGRLYFATNSKVWGLNDDGPGASKLWPEVDLGTTLSPALFAVGGTTIFVGGGDGRLYQLDTSLANLTTPPVVKFEVVGDGLGVVGSPTRDTALNLIYVGSDAGVIYAVQPPLTAPWP